MTFFIAHSSLKKSMHEVLVVPLWRSVGRVPNGNNCKRHPVQGAYIWAARGHSGSQAGSSSIVLLMLASVRGRRVPEDIQRAHARADRDPQESLQPWSQGQGSQEHCSWERTRGLVLSFSLSTQGSSGVYPLLLIYSKRIRRKCKISEGICKYNFFLVGHCHRNYCYRI